MSGFGAGLGTVIGSSMALGDLQNGQTALNQNTASTQSQTQPFVQFGQSFLPSTAQAVGSVASQAGQAQGYNQFMQNYQNTPAAQYQEQQANQVQNNSAAATGGLLSGSNERALGTIDQGIVSQGANTAYNEYLQGNQQNFGQLESSLGNMFNAIGVGTTGTGQDVSLTNSLNTATEANAQAQATASSAKGSGIGSMFGGTTSPATKF
jgi:hypothetical protein